jgi:hypothetical protein
VKSKGTANANRKTIPDDIKKRADEIVRRFNATVIKNADCYYVARYKGSYLYLDRIEYGRLGPICRLKYSGDLTKWEFAIFKYSDEVYDPEEWFFPGSQYVDGTIEGAMRAGREAYPF